MELGDSKLGQREIGDFRLRSMTQLQLVRCGSKIQRFEGARPLRLNPSQQHGPPQVRLAPPGHASLFCSGRLG